MDRALVYKKIMKKNNAWNIRRLVHESLPSEPVYYIEHCRISGISQNLVFIQQQTCFFFKNNLQMSRASLFGMVKSVLSHYPKIPDRGIKIRAFALLDTFQQKVWLLREQQSLVLLVPLHCTMVQSVTKISKYHK